ncbi:putative cell wall-associated hydrolase [Acinetobacter baumannii 1428368]|nr:putative cell wall-associated hydrolase [Acinetobacter baumannii 1428368]
MRLASQPVHQRFVHSGPLVLGADPLKFPAPTVDRDRTVSRRSKPSSRTSLNGEQPYPWDLLQPQDEMSRHRGAKHRRRYELLAVSACYPQSTFYPLSDGPSIQNHRITKTYFRTCSTCGSRS